MQIFTNGKRRFYSFVEFYMIQLKYLGVKILVIIVYHFKPIEKCTNAKLTYFLSQFLPPPYFFEPISPSSLNGYVSFSPFSLLFPHISPSSQLFLGHFSLLPILFLPPLLVSFQVQETKTEQNSMPAVKRLIVELTKEKLDTMFNGLGKIRNQLSSVLN